MDDLVQQGKVLYVAFSDTPDWIVAESNARAELMGWSRFVAMQIPYSLLDRAVPKNMAPDESIQGTSQKNPISCSAL